MRRRSCRSLTSRLAPPASPRWLHACIQANGRLHAISAKRADSDPRNSYWQRGPNMRKRASASRLSLIVRRTARSHRNQRHRRQRDRHAAGPGTVSAGRALYGGRCALELGSAPRCTGHDVQVGTRDAASALLVRSYIDRIFALPAIQHAQVTDAAQWRSRTNPGRQLHRPARVRLVHGGVGHKLRRPRMRKKRRIGAGSSVGRNAAASRSSHHTPRQNTVCNPTRATVWLAELDAPFGSSTPLTCAFAPLFARW